MNKGKPSENPFIIIAQNQEFELNIYITPLWKFNLSKTRMEQSMESNFFQKFEEKIRIFTHILDILLKKDFSENPLNLNMGI